MYYFNDESLQYLRNLTITQVYWHGNLTIGLQLSDGQTCKAGDRDFINSHIFDPVKKITKVEVIIHMWEVTLLQINFYHHQQRLVQVGQSDDYVNLFGRVEVFSIDDDEHLIGCELHNRGKDCIGVTWIKMKVY